MNDQDFADVANLPVEFQPFDMFYIDMGVSLFDRRVGPMTKKEGKLLGEPLWTVKTKIDKEAQAPLTVEDLRRLAKIERSWRSEFIRFGLEKSDLSVDQLLTILGNPRYVDWQGDINYSAFYKKGN